jgi:hypothetical protein
MIVGLLESLIKQIMGDGFDPATDSLKAISDKLDNIKR